MFAALLCTVLFSVSVSCGHRSARLIGGTEANFWRLTCAGLMLGVWSYAWGHGLGGIALPLFLLSGIAGIGVGDVALFQALPRLGSRRSMLLIQCLTAPFGALVEWLWLGTTLTAWQIGCGLLVLLGVGVALAPGEQVRMPGRRLAVGVLASIIAALGGAFGAVLSRKAYAEVHAAGETMDGGTAAFQRILAGLFLAGVCLLIVKRREFRIQSHADPALILEVSKRKWRGVWFWIFLNSLAGQTLGVSCMQWAFETTPTGIVLSIIAMTPVVVIPFAYVLEHERPTWHSLAGALIAISGVIGLVAFR